jgi:cytoplasmic iron level regulating protein YaaA (DUF328/UPF0246 family)
METTMKTICLVSCAKTKRDGYHPAKDLYVSDLYAKSVRYAEQNADDWWILSAKYGLLNIDTIIEKYDVTLNSMPTTDRIEWAEQVYRDLMDVVNPGDRVIVLAPQRYAEFLTSKLQAFGVVVDRPLKGLRIGHQLKWLKEHNNG